MSPRGTKVIFLDIDGVMNSHDWWRRRSPETRRAEERESIVMGGTDPLAVARLSRITDATGAFIVVSSTIRLRHRAIDFREHFARYGFAGKILDTTPVLSSERGLEIQAWLDAYPREVSAFVILDDDSDMAHLAHRHIKTSMSMGLLDEHVERAIEMLGRRKVSAPAGDSGSSAP